MPPRRHRLPHPVSALRRQGRITGLTKKQYVPAAAGRRCQLCFFAGGEGGGCGEEEKGINRISRRLRQIGEQARRQTAKHPPNGEKTTPRPAKRRPPRGLRERKSRHAPRAPSGTRYSDARARCLPDDNGRSEASKLKRPSGRYQAKSQVWQSSLRGARREESRSRSSQRTHR